MGGGERKGMKGVSEGGKMQRRPGRKGPSRSQTIHVGGRVEVGANSPGGA